MTVEPALLNAMRWRSIGPHRGGRVVAVAGDPVDPATFYFGACGGGVWKSDDGGTYWENISDGFIKTAPVGALAVSDSDPSVIYAGMGEACIRGNVIHGDGVYRSTDAGRTWAHLGLEDTRHISRIRIHPRDPDTAYVAALGHAFGKNRERGIFRTRDGGKTWEQVLFRGESAGACDLALDPSNPRVLYAALWDVVRTPWSLNSGGPDSGLYRSTDGGDTWTEITNNPGLPGGLKGRIGVAVSPAKSGRVWAVIEAEQGGLFRSDDGGETWETVSEDRELRQRPWYYMHVFADPQNPETCYIMNLKMWKSTDGGRTFTQITTPHGDNHDIWIDPRNPQRMVQGNDGGANVSYNGGASWSSIYNQPTAQFYHVATDQRFPYHVYGTQQDNSAIALPSRGSAGAIPFADCYPVGSSESGHIQVDPRNPNVVYSGAVGSAPGGGGVLLRYDRETGQTRIITVWPEIYGGWGPKDLKYRFQWTYPILISPHDPGVLYTCGNQVFKSTDEGTSWETISPDLTRNDAEKLGPSGGPITRDTTGAEHYCTIFAFAESPHERGVLWAGSDDGLVHLSRDAGASWQNITPPQLPEWSTITTIEPSPHEPAAAYLTATRYKLDDFRPLIYKTSDYGQTWQEISSGIAADDISRVIREDPERRGLLYAGCESGVYVSFEDGAAWQRLQANLPPSPVHDLQVKDGDLVAATHGRSFWVLDDLSPLRQLTQQIAQKPTHLFPPRPTVRTRPLPGAGRPGGPGKNYSMGLGAGITYREKKDEYGRLVRTFIDSGQNPPEGVAVTYWLKEKPAGEVMLSFQDAQGGEIKRFTSKKAKIDRGSDVPPGEEGAEGVGSNEAADEAIEDVRVPGEAGANRFVWNLRYPDAHKVPGDVTTEAGIPGPAAPPGSYSVRLTVDGQGATQRFEIVKDPRVAATQADFDTQLDFLLRIRDKLSEANDAVNQLRSVRDQVEAWLQRSGETEIIRPVRDAGDGVKKALTEIEDELIQSKVKGQLDSIHFPSRLTGKLAALPSVVGAADAAPPKQTYAVYDELSGRIDTQLSRLKQVIESDVPAFNRLVREAELPAVDASLKPKAKV